MRVARRVVLWTNIFVCDWNIGVFINNDDDDDDDGDDDDTNNNNII